MSNLKKILENQIKNGISEREIRLSWKADIDNYKKIRKNSLLKVWKKIYIQKVFLIQIF